MKVDMNQFLGSFFDEADEHVENMEAALLELESSPDDTELLNTVFRAAHSIKGASSTFGVKAVGEFTHILESLLDRMREGEIMVTSESTEVLLKSVDVLSGLLTSAKDGSAPPDDVDEVAEQLQQINGGQSNASSSLVGGQDEPKKTPQPECYQVAFKPSENLFHLGLDPLLLLRDLRDCGTITEIKLDDSEIPPLAEMDPEACYLAWTLTMQSSRSAEEIQEVFMFVDDETIVDIRPVESSQSDGNPQATESQLQEKSDTPTESEPVSTEKSTKPVHRESVRVNGERLDDMINQIGELVIGISMVEQEWSSMHGGMESAAITQLSKIVRDLQEQSLSLRMVPVAATFQKMARIVRDLSNRLGKQIHFKVTGEETELDKTVVDQIGDPLIHMIRNAVDHGIECPADRVAAGKPAEGEISVRAYHQGGNIYIELRDDGKGLDLESIRQKAIDRKVIHKDDKLSDQEICDLVFHAGLSTASAVSDVSGRGVGMDVVRRNIDELKGSVSLTSQPGQGTTVTIRLPLTLAILDGLLVQLGSEAYVIPLLSVVESFRPQRSEIKRLANNMEVVQVRGEVVPILRLHSILQMDAMDKAVQDPSEGLLVIVEDHEAKIALLVDDLLGQQQAVIKNLESNFRKVPGIAGATILGDGRVALIIDIVSLKGLTEKPNNGSDSQRVA